ncbi:MurR/RpiR family transcriptional regulator [candidate division KSB1 bacterium]|nr:MurR/RpiR family transcriptional regulator [candidate division KSB1 bacterium]
MKDPIDLINKRYKSFRTSEKRVAKFVQENADEVITLSIQGLAKKCATSDATVLRFCRSLGYFGFSDFKTALVTILLKYGRKTKLEIDPELEPHSKKDQYLKTFQERIDSTIRNCNYDDVQQISKRLTNAGRIICIGFGGSAGVAHILSDSLCSLGLYCICPTDPSLIHNLVPLLNSNDIVIGISYSGETEEVVSALNTAKEHSIFTVGLTNFSPSPLANTADITLMTSVPDIQLGGYSCQVRITQLALLELVIHECYEELAKIHLDKSAPVSPSTKK